MDERKDIYKQPDQPPGGEDLPAYEPTPEQMLSQARRKTVLFWVLLAAFAIFTGFFAWTEAGKNSAQQDFTDKLNVTRAPTPAPMRVVPALPMTDQELHDDLFTNRAMMTEISADRMSVAMSEIRDAKKYLDARDWDNAESHLTNALAIWPEMTLALRLRGIVFTQRGQFEEAVLVLERALKKDPFNAETYNTLATALIQKKQFERAEELLNTALSIRPDYAASHVNLGLLYVLTKRYDIALEQLLVALPAMPENSAILNNIAVCYIRMNRFEEARDRLHALINHEPTRAGAYFNIAMTYALQKDTEAAISWIRQGAAQCTPVDVQRFLTDPDFDSLRDKKEYQALIRELYPQLPPGPGT